jgi:cell division protein FtsA
MASDDLNFVLGIDIGSTKVCSILAKQVGSSLKVIGMSKKPCDGVSKGKINNLQKTRDAIQKSLAEATRQAGFDYQNAPELLATVNIGGTQIRFGNQRSTVTRKSAGNEVVTEDVDELFQDIYHNLNLEGQHILHVLPGDFVIDDEAFIYEPVGRIGRRLGGDFKLISTQKQAVGHLQDSLKGAYKGLNGANVVLSPLASALSVLSENQKEVGVAVVDIGGGTTDIAIYHKNILRHAAIIPFGGKHITSDIEEGCMMTNESAERAKLVLNNADPASCANNVVFVVPMADGLPSTEVFAKNVTLIMKVRLQEIAMLVLAEIKKAGYENRLRGGIVLTGGSAQIVNIDKIFHEMTGIPAQIGVQRNIEATDLYDDVVNDPSCATAMGLVWSSIKSLDSRMPTNIQKTTEETTSTQTSTKTSAVTKVKNFWGKLMNEDPTKFDNY